jgi:DNA polymerase III subunit beta
LASKKQATAAPVTGMSATINRKMLAGVLTAAGKAIEGKSSLNELRMAKIEVKDGRCIVTGSNLEVWIEQSFELEDLMPNDGSICLPCSLLSALVGKYSGDVSIVCEGGSAIVSSDRSKQTILGLAADTYPVMPDYETVAEFEIPIPVLYRAITSTIVAASVENIRPVLAGVHVEASDMCTTFVASDTHSIACFTAPYNCKPNTGAKVTIPGDIARMVAAVLPSSGRASVKMGPTQIELQWTVEGVSTRIISRILTDQFPPWRKAIPGKEYLLSTSTMNRDLLKLAFDRALLFDTGKVPRVAVSPGEETWSVNVETGMVGGSDDTVPAAIDGETVAFGINGRYVLETLPVMQTETVEMRQYYAGEREEDGSIKPHLMRMVFYPVKSGDVEIDDYFCLILPMQMM